MEERVVLIVDDEPHIIEHLSALLTSEHFKVVSSATGLGAISSAIEHKPAIIILDIFLPDLDGGAVAAKLAEKEATRNIPIIYLTGLVTKEEEPIVKKTGQHFVLAKPVLKEELIGKIKEVLA